MPVDTFRLTSGGCSTLCTAFQSESEATMALFLARVR